MSAVVGLAGMRGVYSGVLGPLSGSPGGMSSCSPSRPCMPRLPATWLSRPFRPAQVSKRIRHSRVWCPLVDTTATPSRSAPAVHLSTPVTRARVLARAAGRIRRVVGMSLSYRIGEIEQAIPYADVNPKWASTSRDRWVDAVLTHHASGKKLAELTLELLDAFTPACKKFLWADDAAGFARVRDACERFQRAVAKKPSAPDKGLREVRDNARFIGKALALATRELLGHPPTPKTAPKYSSQLALFPAHPPSLPSIFGAVACTCPQGCHSRASQY